MQEFFNNIMQTVRTMSFSDIVDIACVSVLFYYIYKFMRDRRSGKLAAGIVLLFALEFISELFDMYVIQFLLDNVFQVGLLALVVVFQPELRSALEKVGGQPLKSLRSIGDLKNDPVRRVIENVATAAAGFSDSKTGALIVFERLTKLGDLIATGTVLDAQPSTFLIRNVFYDKSPLHDGALIIRDGRLHAAGCLLPLSQNLDIIRDLGTRHRAAIGTSENSDAVVVIVSEETGVISVAVEGVLYRGFNKASLMEELQRLLIPDVQIAQRTKIFKKRTSDVNSTEKEAGSDAK